MVQTAGFLNSRRLESIVRIKRLFTPYFKLFWEYYLLYSLRCQEKETDKDDKPVTLSCDSPQFQLGFFVQKSILQIRLFLCMITTDMKRNYRSQVGQSGFRGGSVRGSLRHEEDPTYGICASRNCVCY